MLHQDIVVAAAFLRAVTYSEPHRPVRIGSVTSTLRWRTDCLGDSEGDLRVISYSYPVIAAIYFFPLRYLNSKRRVLVTDRAALVYTNTSLQWNLGKGFDFENVEWRS
jgi:hypothetical protein